MPHPAVRDGAIHALEKFLGMMARVQDAMILPDQLFFGIFTDGAKFLVHVSDGAVDVGDSYDGVLIQSKFLISEFFEGGLGRDEAFFRHFFRPLALGDIGTDCDILAWLSIFSSKRDDGGIHPIKRAILGSVVNFVMPHLSIDDAAIHLLEEFFGMVA